MPKTGQTLTSEELYNRRLPDPARCQYVGKDIGDDDGTNRCENKPTVWVRREDDGSAGTNNMKSDHDEHTLCFCDAHKDGIVDGEKAIETGAIDN